MQAIKKVFSSDDHSNTSPSGHFRTDDETDHTKSASHSANTPNHAAPSAPAKIAEKVAGVDPSHAAGARSDSQAHTGDSRTGDTGTHVVGGAQNRSTNENPASSTSNGLDGDRTRSSTSGNTEGLTGAAAAAASSATHGGNHDHSRSTTDSHNNTSGLTGSSHNTGASHGGIAGRAEQAIEQHAAPPQHTHKQPTEHTHLDQNHAKDATHDHKHLAPVVRESRYAASARRRR